jgi:hypothetical protein
MARSPYTMPIIVLNMGSEMVYILNQRLQAQSIQEEKAKKVSESVLVNWLCKLACEYCTTCRFSKM